MADFTTFQRSLTMAVPPDQIAPHLVDLRRWVEWSPWEGLDPELTRTYAGPSSGTGSSYEWSGNRRAGAGRMQITAATAEAIDLDLEFTRPFKSASQVNFALVPAEGATEVVWTMRSPRTLTTRIFGVIMNMEKTIGKDLEKGLANLRALVEG